MDNKAISFKTEKTIAFKFEPHVFFYIDNNLNNSLRGRNTIGKFISWLKVFLKVAFYILITLDTASR